MPIVSTIHHCLFLPVRVELPEACPHCQADFTQGHNLREWNTTEIAYAGNLVAGDNPHFEPDDDDASTDTYHPIAYVCGCCGVEIEGASTLLIEDAQLNATLCRLADIPPQ